MSISNEPKGVGLVRWHLTHRVSKFMQLNYEYCARQENDNGRSLSSEERAQARYLDSQSRRRTTEECTDNLCQIVSDKAIEVWKANQSRI